MPRVPRINLEGALYYVTSRGDHNEAIFKEAGDYAAYLDLLKKGKEQYNFKLFAFCLLPNHIHLLIELAGDTTISQIMYGLNSNYTKYFNAKHHKEGHLFQERYEMALLEKEPNLLNMTAYIHLNPKALASVPDIASYPYSSYPSYIYYSEGKGSKSEAVNMAQEVREVTGHLKEGTYSDFINKMLVDEMARLGKILAKKSVVGSDGFVEKVMSKVESEKQKTEEHAPANVQKPLLLKKAVAAEGAAIIILVIIVLIFYTRTIVIRENFRGEIQKKDDEVTAKLRDEKRNIRRDLDEKYRADKASYEETSKMLEAEKKKADALKKELRARARKDMERSRKARTSQ